MYRLKPFHTFVNEAWMKTSPLSGELMDKYGDAIEKLHLYEWDKNYLELNMIRIRSSYRGKGIASEILQRIVDYADDFDKIVHLTPTDEFGSNKKRLTNFYKGFGFVSNRKDNKDFKVKDTMIRFPNK